MARKVIAAVMDVSFVKFCRKEWIIKRITKKCLVYDPNKIVPLPPPKLDSDRK